MFRPPVVVDDVGVAMGAGCGVVQPANRKMPAQNQRTMYLFFDKMQGLHFKMCLSVEPSCEYTARLLFGKLSCDCWLQWMYG